MADDALDPQAATPSQLRARLGGGHAGAAFLVYRDGGGSQQVFPLEESAGRVTLGRGSATDLWLAWDEQVSRVHAELERVGDDWCVVDDGLSANGTFCNGERVERRRRLRDGDVLRVGDTELTYRSGLEEGAPATRVTPPPG